MSKNIVHVIQAANRNLVMKDSQVPDLLSSSTSTILYALDAYYMSGAAAKTLKDELERRSMKARK